MPKKYELVEQDALIYEGKKLNRVRALVGFKTANGFEVKPGDMGGYIEGTKNLSQAGTAWVADEAIVVGDAKVKENAFAYGSAIICDKAVLSGGASVGGYCVIGGQAAVLEQATLAGELYVGNNARLKGRAVMTGKDRVMKRAA